MCLQTVRKEMRGWAGQGIQDTVADIAQQVGYINQSKFATAFREIMKISPTEYRSQYEANPKTILHD